MKSFWSRLTVHWHVAAAAFIAALPSILNWLGVIDLRPILAHFMPDNYVNLTIGILPFVLAFLKPLVALAPTEPPQ